ncbi:FlaA1/EpsC-like NDP-sugar epimerase [Parabacteroides sp. PF5-5]|uniref:polysaccharide biosynthesis protein n=1 Tax=unclassified Parabacteroides TaxID=2649774 RepID=UPI00247490C2|nr:MULTISPECIES: nucleoside-diphosphate sugar epimerase/dehydratase [unclassified Parabacteroides]MDH6316379.1 FlaA1/EpsC-like NDP-sugar epimerase [Parabacteroides sp. PF5-13]MDH6327566.1 FlaA1/EpsC-like NDP-sugar epimerase [Parabacteroides sp. PH5-41]MDH6335294.1 FlaA1/EpsC-like NDP-sugar epimerase [Parabacteroides sp. PF5-5]MDH6346357.1 FlaA1/EpsC-like NDP-sugar epimerase [Parabacteroides sp. PH5-46]MDH6361392.1 FlaA1/EpsC-like NDP-sugar epimerase [Parabacteroides sp. PH5-16]
MGIRELLTTLSRIKYINRWLVFILDLVFSTIATGVALAFTYYIISYVDTSGYAVSQFFAFSVLSSVLTFLGLQTHKNVIRHSTFVETGRIAIAALLKVVFLFILMKLFLPQWTTPKGFLLLCAIDFWVSFFILTTFRVVLILAYNFVRDKSLSGTENLLIFGTEDTSVDLLNSSLKNIKGNYRIVGCITNGKNRSLRIGGYKVFSIKDQEAFNQLVDSLYVKAVLFPDYHSVKYENERFVRYAEKKHVRMLLAPTIREMDGGKVNYRNLPEVRIEDLLNREEITINLEEIAASLKNKVVLVTGAAGSIGSELCHQICSFGVKQLVLFDSAETPMHNLRLELEEKFPKMSFIPLMGDVRMPERVESVFRRFHPEIVFHAAAYKHVPLMEENPCEAVLTNVQGTRTVADLAVTYKVHKFVMISTDKAVNPTNVMGASKRLAEMYVQSLGTAISKGEYAGNTRFVTTRFGNVLGSNGSVIPRFRDQLAKGGPLTVTDPEIIRYFMTIPEACRLVLEASFMGNGNEIFIFDMGTPVKIADLAKRMIELAGLEVGNDIKIEYTGLRPGEKLYEELLNDKESTIPTSNKKIFKANIREYTYSDIVELIDELSIIASTVNKKETVRLMKNLVPEFVSQNSEYEMLDKETLLKNDIQEALEISPLERGG